MKPMYDRGLALLTRVIPFTLCLVAGLSITSSAAAIAGGRAGAPRATEANQTTAKPVYDRKLHVAGNLRVAISNYGRIPGDEAGPLGPLPGLDDNYPPLTGCSELFEFPAGTCIRYLYDGGLWVGGIVGGDTLVSQSIYPLSNGSDEFAGFDSIRQSSDLPDSPFYDPKARSQQQLECGYYDTLVLTSRDESTGRLHKPLGLAVRQTSYSWLSAPYDDFIIIEYSIRNISSAVIESAYVGFFFDSDAWTWPRGGDASDDISGYLRGEGIAYTTDNDGDPTGDSVWNAASCRGAFGVVPLRIDPAPCCTTFNWWTFATSGWGPAGTNSSEESGRAPSGDNNRYATMANGEIDYDQLWAAVDMENDGWGPPTAEDAGIAYGMDARFLLSYGSFNLAPGDSIRIAVALVAGDSLHQNPSDHGLYFNPLNPQPFYNRLYFGDLIRNAEAARRIYTNGFEPVGGAPVHISAEPMSDTTVLLRWSPAPFRSVGGYRVYRRLQGGDDPWEVLNNVGPDLLVAADLHVKPPETYEYEVSAIDTAGEEGPKSRPAVLAAGRPLVIPSLSAKGEGETVRLTWSAPIQPPGFSPWEFLNIYRRPLRDEPSILRVRIPVSASHVSGPFRRAMVEAASAGPRRTLMPKPVQPAITGEFIDSAVVSGKEYFYSASLTNALGLEGAESAVDSLIPMAFDRSAVVVVMMSDPSSLEALVKPDSTRSFYFDWAGQAMVDTLFIDLGWFHDEYPDLGLLSHYRCVISIWEEALPGGSDASFAEGLEDYISNGGRCLLIGRYIPSRLANSWWFPLARATTVHVFSEGRFASRVLGVRRQEVESVWPTGGACVPSVQFVTAKSAVTGYPTLQGDSARALDNPYFTDLKGIGEDCSVRGGGVVPAVGVIDSIVDAEVLYTYEAGYPDTSSFQGRPIAIRRDYGNGRVILFNFPLSVMERPAAWDALDAAMSDLGADDLGPAAEAVTSVPRRISEFLFGPTGRTPDAAWDLNGDGLVDVYDLVLSIKTSIRAAATDHDPQSKTPRH